MAVTEIMIQCDMICRYLTCAQEMTGAPLSLTLDIRN